MRRAVDCVVCCIVFAMVSAAVLVMGMPHD